VREEAEMLSIGKLNQDKRGAGSIIGAVFLVLILLSGYTFYTLNVTVANDYTQTLQDIQQLDLKRNKEIIEFLSVSFDQDKLNITVKNKGPYLTHLIWLGVFDETANSQDYYMIEFYVNPSETVTNIGDDTILSFEEQERTIQLVTEFGNAFSYIYPPSEEETEYYFVDQEGNPPEIGTHSFFDAQRSGPDGVYDTLSEANEQWISPTGYEDPGDEWLTETNAYDDETETSAGNDIPGRDTWSSYLVLTHSAITSNMIRYYIEREDDGIGQVEIDLYNGTWMNAYSGTGTWDEWANVSFAETSSVTKMRFRFLNTHPSPVQNRMAYVREADFISSSAQYELNLEVQWTDLDFDEPNEWVCVYCGDMGSEDLRLDVWNGSAWINVFTDLESGWNSVDVSLYLVSSTFKIRFRDSIKAGDFVQDSWEIDATLLHVWTSRG
jgi:hypothetical protein